MKIIKFIILCFFFSQYSGIKAQWPNITVESMPGFPAQANFNQSYGFTVFLHNNDSAYFQGDICIVFHTDIDTSNIIIDTIGGPFPVNIPGDSFSTISVSGFHFDPGSFKIGGNVVVVWPVSSGGTIMSTDSFNTYVEILGYAGISGISQINSNNNLFPVPASDVLSLPQNIAENNIEYIKIIDMLGRQKYYSDKTVTSINTSFFEQGIYFIEIKEKNKTPQVLKFIISR